VPEANTSSAAWFDEGAKSELGLAVRFVLFVPAHHPRRYLAVRV
jgi:hypothetical protein